VRTIVGPVRIDLYHIRAAYRAAMKAAMREDPRLFVPEPGDRIVL
jgi:hypothetical protein